MVTRSEPPQPPPELFDRLYRHYRMQEFSFPHTGEIVRQSHDAQLTYADEEPVWSSEPVLPPPGGRVVVEAVRTTDGLGTKPGTRLTRYRFKL